MHRVRLMQGGAGDVTRLSIGSLVPISRDREGASLANGAATGMAAAVVLMRQYRPKWCTTAACCVCTYRMHRVRHMQGGAGDVMTRLVNRLTCGRAGQSAHSRPVSA